ncbi:hypothetical protein ABL840_21585 [Variovorax sp. NFACC27]|uniref:hypothetical protein n=1 Tax=unclassified Variovorax TaxID=663243 RepID=UPI0008976011|nr:hypothetical protein [Variovorax sp. YR750]SEF32546.1 hypothetical protein SAMN03159371_05994 [Variovorax sp. NFACC28]SEG94571.1 hypothetical protein SAMN03159365_06072 [Variovorax sp. NFACC29]SFD71001.1 hypothetical protein SAMN03159379_06031 [Variovorax sp. NFACC26]SFG84876.1 hypothetical protein SAMN03159447_05191 [Variovorax sp. NFACC27]SEK38892.1 hypothetical protein SAMN05518845_101165 [Variovorax sp. YR750]
MDWFVSDMGGDKFPHWMRRLGISKDDGEVVVPAAIAGNEYEVALRAEGDGVPRHHRDGHVYVSATWLSNAFPDASVVCEKLAFIARNNVSSATTDSEAVTQYTQLASQAESRSDAVITQALYRRGFTQNQSRDALWFTPIAFGRRLLQSKNMKFSDNFLVLSPNGEVLQEGQLSDNSIYRSAVELAPALLSDAAIKHVAFRSPEIRSFADAVSKGASAEDLEWTPVIFFSSSPMSQGLERASQVTSSFLGPDRN